MTSSRPLALARAVGEGHMAHIKEMAAARTLALAGPFEQPDDAKGALAGILVFDVRTREEAVELASADPAVKAHRFRLEILEWYGPKSLICVLEGAGESPHAK